MDQKGRGSRYSTQNSLPSGSCMTTSSSPSRRTDAPRAWRRATSSEIPPGARRSKCRRFLAVFSSGTRLNHMFGPPQPAASTYALSRVDSSSTLAPRAAAQNLASSRASRQSDVTLLMNVTTPPSSQALRRLLAFIRRRRSAPSLPQNSHDQHRTMSARERRGRDRATMKASEVQRALAAAMSIASSLDLTVDDTIVLHDSNKLTLRLLPCDVLARVAFVAHET